MPDPSDPIFVNEDAARAWLEAQRWPAGVVCPWCDRRDRVKPLAGKSMGDGWYHCGGCRRKFTVRVGTLYERSHVPLHKWLMATHILAGEKERAITVERLCVTVEVSYRTGWRMMRLLREAISAAGPPIADE